MPEPHLERTALLPDCATLARLLLHVLQVQQAAEQTRGFWPFFLLESSRDSEKKSFAWLKTWAKPIERFSRTSTFRCISSVLAWFSSSPCRISNTLDASSKVASPVVMRKCARGQLSPLTLRSIFKSDRYLIASLSCRTLVLLLSTHANTKSRENLQPLARESGLLHASPYFDTC